MRNILCCIIYAPRETITRVATQSMPQLDFREALSTPEEKNYSPAVAASAAAMQTPPVLSLAEFLHNLRLSRSAWANIVFVMIASVGGLVCAFYFFNGGELLRAAASWPGEYLYRRPLAVESLVTAEQPTPVDQFAASADQTSARKNEDLKTAANSNAAPTDLTPPVNTIGSTTPPVATEPPPIAPVLPPIVPPEPTSAVDQVTGNVNTTVSGGTTLLQSFVQDPVGATSSTLATATTMVKKSKKTTTSRRKTTQRKLASTTSAAKSITQQTVTQTQIGTATVRPVNQIMTGGGLGGGGSITAIGSGGGTAGTAAGSAAGAGAGTVGGASGGLGGLNAGGLGGTISGVGGTVGGVIGGHH